MEQPDGPVTRTELRHELGALEERMGARLGEMEDRLVERMRDMQTEIIRAMVDVQQNNENRLGNLERTDAAVLERLAHLEKQVREVRVKLLLEPPAA